LSCDGWQTEAEWERMSNWTREIYSGFIDKVATCRHLEASHVDAELAQGRIWHGAEAVENGLVDELGGLEDAICYAAQMAS
jgi:protease-4